SAAAACKSSVDLPTPGSPPTRMADAGTRPPPQTRSNSEIPLARRDGGSASPANSTKASFAPFLPLGTPSAPGTTERAAVSSTSVFHSPQESHLPIHLRLKPPQDWQAYRVWGCAIGFKMRL